ncbi:MAG: HDIG domain-containing protein [Deltaproteobacteria bacterium]|nr:HDIG domain-containing protein [Deltaproteobacteria bacterium]
MISLRQAASKLSNSAFEKKGKIGRFLIKMPGFKNKESTRWNKAEDRVMVNPALLRICLLFFLALLLAFLAFPEFLPREIEMEIGDVADQDIKADQDLMILDQTSTAAKREAASRSVSPVFDLNDQAVIRARGLIHSAFDEGRSFYRPYLSDISGEHADIPPPSDSQSLTELKKRFYSTFSLDAQSGTFEAFAQINFSLRVEEVISQLVTEIMERGIVADRDLLSTPENQRVTVRYLSSKKEKTYPDTSGFFGLSHIQQVVMSKVLLFRDDFKPRQIKAIVTVARSILQPNLILNQAEAVKRRMEAVRKVSPVYFQVKRGEMIVREGQRVDELASLKLKALTRSKAEFNGFPRLGGVFILAIIFLGVIYITGFRHFHEFKLSDKDLIFLSFLLVISLLLADAASLVGQPPARGGVNLEESALLYMVPLAAGGMVTAIFLGPVIAILYAVSISILTGLLLESFFLSFFYFIGATVGLVSVGRAHERGAIIKSGLLVGLVNIGVLLGLSLYYENFLSYQTLIECGAGLLNGLLAGIVVTGLIPLIEMIFGYTTNIKLMELANLDRPILRELMVQAPGTYHHSVIVGVLVEAAAESIGANPLLAKVSAYYHDIGKLKKPLYFVENQMSGHNKHEKLAPSMSSLVLISHVKDGVELARQHKLGQDIVDIIQQHHGTSLISYFYQKARECQGEDQPEINVEDYRYPGPRPQTKEAGLVLLADAAEAVSRTLLEPTPARIQGMVQKVINNIFSDGQLDECELTLKDLHLIASSFNKILTGIFHRRIDYPEFPAKESSLRVKTANGHNRIKQSTNDSSDKDGAINGAGQEDLRRLGIS